jgi:hypothetical protein
VVTLLRATPPHTPLPWTLLLDRGVRRKSRLGGRGCVDGRIAIGRHRARPSTRPETLRPRRSSAIPRISLRMAAELACMLLPEARPPRASVGCVILHRSRWCSMTVAVRSHRSRGQPPAGGGPSAFVRYGGGSVRKPRTRAAASRRSCTSSASSRWNSSPSSPRSGSPAIAASIEASRSVTSARSPTARSRSASSSPTTLRRRRRRKPLPSCSNRRWNRSKV